jgi:PDZ domain-containing secreted protein
VESSAYADHLKNADRIVSVNGVTVNTTAEFEAVIENCAIGDTLVIMATRGKGEAFEVQITLRELVPASAQ